MKKKTVVLLSGIALLTAIAISLAWLPKINSAALPQKKKIVFIAGGCSHGPGEHEHYAGCALLADQLNKQAGTLVDAVVYKGWPADSSVLNDAAAIVLYMDGGEGHAALPHLDHLNKLMKKGTGLACLHYAVEVPKDTGGVEFKNWIGGYFETNWSVNPHWDASYNVLPKHPVTNGVKPFTIKDEWYYHMRFRDNMKGVTPILSAVPPASTLDREMGPHSNNEWVGKEVAAKKPQVMCWTAERSDGGRGFGFTGGHQHTNWGNENFRKVVLNGIVWTARVTVPANGIPAPALTDAELQKNLDRKPCSQFR